MAAIFKIWNTYIGPSTNAGMDLGSDSFKWNNLYIDGVAYLDGLTMAGNVDMNDFSLQNIAYLYGADATDYIRMGISNRLIINITGGGSPFSTPDIDVTGSSYFDDDMGFPIDKKILFGDENVGIFSDDDGYLDLTADLGIRLNGDTTFKGNVNFTSSGEVNLMFYEGDLVSYEEEAVFYN